MVVKESDKLKKKYHDRRIIMQYEAKNPEEYLKLLENDWRKDD